MKVLVTGGSGLIGNALKEIIGETETDYIFLSSKQCNLKDEMEVNLLFENIKPDIVVHLASVVAGLYGNMSNNYNMFIDNVKMNTNILNACNKFNISRLINILSTCVFGNDLRYPLTSSQMHDKLPDSSNEGYAHAKRILSIGSEILTKNSNTQVVNLIPTNLYGKYDNYNLENGHVLPVLIHKLYLAQQSNTPLNIRGTGIARRQFIYANDFAKIILHFIKCTLSKQYNSLIVGPPEKDEISIKKLIHALVKEFKFKNEIVYDSSFSDGQYKKTVDNTELLEYIPDFKFTCLESGLKDTIEYFTTYYDIIRK